MLLALPWHEAAEEQHYKHFYREAFGQKIRVTCATLTLRTPSSLQWSWAIFLWDSHSIMCQKQIEGTFPALSLEIGSRGLVWKVDVQHAQRVVDQELECLGYKIVPQKLELLI